MGMKSLKQRIESSWKKLGVAAASTALGISLLTPNNSKADGLYGFINGGGNLVCEPKVCEISNVPEYVRDVPIHEDDKSGDMAPIADTKLSYPPLSLNLGISLGLGYQKKDYDFMLGGNLNYTLFTIFYSDKHNIKERTYKGIGKEVGAALTYYGFVDNFFEAEDVLTPGLFFRASKDFGWKYIYKHDHLFEVFLKYNVDFFDLYIENGWDRYSSLETYKKHKLADLTKHTIKIGLGKKTDLISRKSKIGVGRESEFFIGAVIPDSKPTYLGKQADLRIPPHFISGIDVRWIITAKNKYW